MLFKLITVTDKEKALMAIPETCADKIISLYHDTIFAGHQGVIKTYLTIINKFFIPNLMHYLRAFLKACHICQLSRNDKPPSRQLEMRINLNYRPMSRLSMDLTFMPRSQKAHWYILCIIDEVTNYLVSALLYQARSEEVGEALIEHITRVSGTYKDYHILLTKRLKYLQNMLQNFKSKCIELINKDREYFQYSLGDLVYLISPLTTQLRTNSRKVSIKYVGLLVVYRIVDAHNYLLMTIDGQLMRGLFEHERLKPAMIRTDQGNVKTLSTLKKTINLEITPHNKITGKIYIFQYQ